MKRSGAGALASALVAMLADLELLAMRQRPDPAPGERVFDVLQAWGFELDQHTSFCHWRWVGPPPRTNPLRQQMNSVRELDQAVGLTLERSAPIRVWLMSAPGAARQLAFVRREGLAAHPDRHYRRDPGRVGHQSDDAGPRRRRPRLPAPGPGRATGPLIALQYS